MQRSDAFTRRWLAGGAALLWLALVGLHVEAAAPVGSRESPAQMVADPGAVMDHAPAIGDCLPCTYCYAAPATSVHGFSGECKEPDPPSWPELAEAPSGTGVADLGRQGAPPVPLRIAYCRWSK